MVVLKFFFIFKCYWPISVFLGQSVKYIFKLVKYIFQFTISCHTGEFRCRPSEKFTRKSHPEKFAKTWHFPLWVKQSPRGETEIGCYKEQKITTADFGGKKRKFEIFQNLTFSFVNGSEKYAEFLKQLFCWKRIKL